MKFNVPQIWLILPAVAFGFIGYNTSDSNLSSLALLFAGVFLGIMANYISSQFGSEKNEWLPLAESSCRQILKTKIGIQRYLAKETGNNSFCSTISEESPDKQLVTKHCEGIDMQLRGIYDDLDCVFIDWENFINTNCKEGECEFIWDRINAIESDTVVHVERIHSATE